MSLDRGPLSPAWGPGGRVGQSPSASLMVDLHSHVLPGVDDGPVNMHFSVALARAAVAAGTAMMVATPHIRADHPVDPDEIAPRVAELNTILEQESIPLEVLAGAEVSLAKARELGDEVLRGLCLGNSRHLLVECPYTDTDEELEATLFELQARGFRLLLAHPERSPAFRGRAERLSALVGRGVLSSVTAGSLAGRFGGSVREFALGLVEHGLVHDVASDAHNHVDRPPGLASAFDQAESELPGITAQASWYTVHAPWAILSDLPLPPAPEPPKRQRSRRPRLRGRV